MTLDYRASVEGPQSYSSPASRTLDMDLHPWIWPSLVQTYAQGGRGTKRIEGRANQGEGKLVRRAMEEKLDPVMVIESETRAMTRA